MRRIIISNDDGIDSEGLKKLAETAKEFGEVWVVAPNGQRSATSHSFNYLEPLIVREVDFSVEGVRAFSCSGTPADCMRVGILKILPEKPELAFAGINNGPNISWDIQYSGTVGAAMESRFLGVHSMAFSQKSELMDEVTNRYLREIMKRCIEKPLGQNEIWNVNFPECRLEDCKGVLWDRTVSIDNFYVDDYDEKVLEDGTREYKMVVGRNWEASEGTDLKAIMENYVSVGVVKNLQS